MPASVNIVDWLIDWLIKSEDFNKCHFRANWFSILHSYLIICIAHLNQIPVPFLKLLFCLLADECVRVVLLKCRHNTLNPLIEAGRFPLSGFSLYAVLVLSDWYRQKLNKCSRCVASIYLWPSHQICARREIYKKVSYRWQTARRV